MTDIECPRCGDRVAGGRFCSQCGASLEARDCPSCGAGASPGDRFCTRCGASLAKDAPPSPARSSANGGRSGDDGHLGWWIAGLVMVALILFLVVPVLDPDRGLQESGAGPAPAGSPPAQGTGAPPDLSSMTPRQAADRLYDRVMRAGEAGDSSEMRDFLPMALGAYERARPLDADGLFHLSVLQRLSTDFEAALETARQGLEEEPDHLLLLSAAAEAAAELGDTAAARGHYTHLLDVWDEERTADREEYRVHEQLLPRLRDDAEAFLQGS